VIPARLYAWIAAAGALLAAVAAIFMRGAKAGRDAAKADAAEAHQQAERKGNEAAADAGRDGAAGRLRDGRF
jgi:uncharacterized membrane protein